MNESHQVTRTIGLMLLGLVLLLGSGCGSGGDEAGNIAASNKGACSNQKACPIADAGPDQRVPVGSVATLDGSQSYAKTTGLITYAWTLSPKPNTSTATLAGATTVRPTFTPDVAGNYTVVLTVNNGGLPSNVDSVTVTAEAGDLAPVANAGPDRTVPSGAPVTLNGSSSADPDGQPITTYSWTMTQRPAKSLTLLLDATTATPSFTPDALGTYKLSLIVGDGALTSTADQVVITVVTGNIAPVAQAGPDQYVVTGQPGTLDGSGSTDANGDTLTYSWSVQSRPAGSTIGTVTNPTTSNPTFTPDLDGFYVVSLIVTDPLGASSPRDMVVITTGPRFTVVPGSNNEAVQDRTTNLVWERVPDTGTRNWDDSIAYCAGKTVGGKDDWRLPSRDELSALYPVTTPPFTYDVANYWSATTNADHPANAWLVDFNDGNVLFNVKTGTNHAWCVRG